MSKIAPCEFGDGKCLPCGVPCADRGECEGFVYPEADPEKLAIRAELDRLRTEAVAADIRIANDSAAIAGLTAETVRLANKAEAQDRVIHLAREAVDRIATERDALQAKLADQDAYVAMRDQRDAALADAKRYRWLRKTTNWVSSKGNRIDVRESPELWDASIDAAMKGEQP